MPGPETIANRHLGPSSRTAEQAQATYWLPTGLLLRYCSGITPRWIAIHVRVIPEQYRSNKPVGSQYRAWEERDGGLDAGIPAVLRLGVRRRGQTCLNRWHEW